MSPHGYISKCEEIQENWRLRGERIRPLASDDLKEQTQENQRHS